MEPEETTVYASQIERPLHRVLKWRRAVVVIPVLAAMITLLAIYGPEGATYEEYLQTEEGMSRREVVAIIGQSDYWHHYEGDRDVTNWVNKDGTYIRAVFDKSDVLIEVSWESGWNPEGEAE